MFSQIKRYDKSPQRQYAISLHDTLYSRQLSSGVSLQPALLTELSENSYRHEQY